jgi:arylsulfatase
VAANVLLIVLDSVRARNVGRYGHDRDATPRIDELAAESVVYPSAWAPTIWTLPSHASMFSGYDVEAHGVTGSGARLDPEAHVFRELSANGYHTGVFTENTWLTEADVGLRDGFETVVGKPSVRYPEALNPGEFAHRNEYGDYLTYVREAVVHDYPVKSLVNGVAAKLQYDLPTPLDEWILPNPNGAYYVDRFLDWTTEKGGEPWAACINLMDAHYPYEPAPEHDRWGDDETWAIQDAVEDHAFDFLDGERPLSDLRKLEDLYDGGVHQCDAAVGRAIDGLRECGLLEETYVVVTADHGEGFGEASHLEPDRPVVEHKQGVHPVQTNVPLFVRPPDGSSAVVDDPVSLTATADVLRSMQDGSFTPATWVRDEPVRISYTGASAQRVGASDDDEVVARSIVWRDGDETRKDSVWGPLTASVRITDAQSDERLDVDPETVRDRVASAFSDVEDRGVRGERREAIDGETLDRLEELGYR